MPLIKKIFITGGTGFFGRALLRFWKKTKENSVEDFSVTVLTRNPDLFLIRYPEFSSLSWLFFVQGDIESLSTFPKGQSFSHILHAATDSTLGPQISPLLRYDQIVNGTRNVLDFALECNASRVLLTSSGGVYGPQPDTMLKIPEYWNGMADPLSVSNVYSVAKRAAEHLCVLYASQYNIKCIIARCFSFVGPDLPLNAHFAIGNFIYDALFSSDIQVKGDGTPVRSYLAQQDLALWLDTLLDKGESCKAYNVGSDKSITLSELATLVRDLVCPEKKIHIKDFPDVNMSVRNRYIPDISMMKKDFSLDVYTSLEDTIVETAEYAKGLRRRSDAG